MRRRTPGVQIAARWGRGAQAHEPERVVRILEPLVTPGRRTRLWQVISQRLRSVAVVLDAPYDPHNGAAVLRSCDAFGVQIVHVLERKGTPFAVASSVARGAEKWIDLVRHTDVSSLLAWARETDTPLVAAHPDGELAPDELAAMPRIAIVLGNEHEGIGDPIARACVSRVRIPMRGFAESLNVSVTAAILIHAATRGRIGDLGRAEQRRLYARGLYLSVPHAEDHLDAQ